MGVGEDSSHKGEVIDHSPGVIRCVSNLKGLWDPLILGLDGDSVGEYIHKDSSDSMDCYILLYCDIYLFEKKQNTITEVSIREDFSFSWIWPQKHHNTSQTVASRRLIGTRATNLWTFTTYLRTKIHEMFIYLSLTLQIKSVLFEFSTLIPLCCLLVLNKVQLILVIHSWFLLCSLKLPRTLN